MYRSAEAVCPLFIEDDRARARGREQPRIALRFLSDPTKVRSDQ